MIAGPSDVNAACEVLSEVIADWNAANSRQGEFILEPVHWTTHTYPEVGTRPQEIIEQQIVDPADVLIAVFWTRLGTPTGVSESGTVEEIERFCQERKPVLLYFCKKDVPHDADLAELQRLRSYQKRISQTSLYREYFSEHELRQMATGHITQLVNELAGGVGVTRRASTEISNRRKSAAAKAFGKIAAIQTDCETQFFGDIPDTLRRKLKPALLEIISCPELSDDERALLRDCIRMALRLEPPFSQSASVHESFEMEVEGVFENIRQLLILLGDKKVSPEQSTKIEKNYEIDDLAATINRVEAKFKLECFTNNFRPLIEELRPILIELIATPASQHIPYLGSMLNSVSGQMTELQRVSLHSKAAVSVFIDLKDKLLAELRDAITLLRRSTLLDEWQLLSYTKLRDAFCKHNGETAFGWPAEKQCQCGDCCDFRDITHTLQLEMANAAKA